MNEKALQSSTKLRGGYYTPSTISNNLANWIMEDPQKKMEILEPSVGDGSMIKPFINMSTNYNLTAIELDPEEVLKAQNLVINDTRFNIELEDFFNFYSKENKKYDAVIGNPPYIRYQFLTPEQREIQSHILKKNGMKPNKLINSWVAFTVACIEMLKDGGKIAFVLPTDLLQVSYAEQLRHFLYEQLSEMTIITFNEAAFEGIQQDVLLLQGVKRISNNNHEDHKLRIINLPNTEFLSNNYSQDFSTLSYNDDKKWTKYLLPNADIVNINNLYASEVTLSLGKLAKVEVGITTGRNEIFTVTQDTIDKYSLSEYARPLLGRSVQANGVLYAENDLFQNIEKQKKVWLLDFNLYSFDKLSIGAKKYISDIEDAGLNYGYKLGLRDEWYKVPSIWAPDAFMLRRIGSFPKLILNELSAVSTDTFHRVKFFNDIDKYWTIFSTYSSIGLLSFELAGRNFGGGALEILPGDINEILVPKKPVNLSLNESKNLVKSLDEKFRSGKNIQSITEYVDQIMIDLNVLNEQQSHCYNQIWGKLNQRRSNK